MVFFYTCLKSGVNQKVSWSRKIVTHQFSLTMTNELEKEGTGSRQGVNLPANTPI